MDGDVGEDLGLGFERIWEKLREIWEEDEENG